MVVGSEWQPPCVGLVSAYRLYAAVTCNGNERRKDVLAHDAPFNVECNEKIRPCHIQPSFFQKLYGWKLGTLPQPELRGSPSVMGNALILCLVSSFFIYPFFFKLSRRYMFHLGKTVASGSYDLALCVLTRLTKILSLLSSLVMTASSFT